MKYLAHSDNTLNSEIISINDVIKDIRNNPKECEKKKYYSLWYLTPMIPKIGNKKTPHFAFAKNSIPNPSEVKGGESIEHSMTKFEIYKRKYLYLRYNDYKNGDIVERISFSKIEAEHEFGKNDYRADLYAYIQSDNNILGLNNTWIIIEICKSHKASKFKKAYYKKNNIPAIELKLWDKIQFKGNTELLQKQIAGWLNTPRYFRWLHNPNYEYQCRNVIHPLFSKEEEMNKNLVFPRTLQKPYNSNYKDCIEQNETIHSPLQIIPTKESKFQKKEMLHQLLYALISFWYYIKNKFER